MKKILILLLFSLFFSCFNEPKKKNENPLKIEKKVQKIENGTYYKESEEESGELTITSSINENGGINFNFEITTWYNNSPCSGSLKGKTKFYSNEKVTFSDEDCEELKFEYLSKNKIEVSETNCYYHGMNCYFSGIYRKNN